MILAQVLVASCGVLFSVAMIGWLLVRLKNECSRSDKAEADAVRFRKALAKIADRAKVTDYEDPKDLRCTVSVQAAIARTALTPQN